MEVTLILTFFPHRNKGREKIVVIFVQSSAPPPFPARF